MKLAHILLDRLYASLLFIANTAQTAADEMMIANGTAFSGGKRIQVSPYGEFPHSQGMQHLTRKEADTIVANFNAERIARGDKFGGLTIFIGHPDVPEFADRFTDTRAVGWIMSLETATDGLYANVEWTPFGEPMVLGKEYKFISPTWFIQRGAKGVLYPTRLKSAGLTNTPNIPVAPLANEQTQNPTKGNPMPQWLLTTLGLPAEATEEQIKATITDLQSAKSTMAGNTARLTKAETDLNNERTAHTATQQSLEGERAARIELAVANAIREGRLTDAEKDQWKKDLVANVSKFDELAARKPVVKTKSVTQGLKSLPVESPAIANIQGLVQKKMKETGEKYDIAFANVKRENPDLFANLKTPETSS